MSANMDSEYLLRVLPKGGKTRPMRYKAKQSSVKFYSELLKDFNDIALACDRCVHPVISGCTLNASRDFHEECQKDRLILFKMENDESGMFIRPRCVKFKLMEGDSICRHVLHGRCCFAGKNCPFPHNRLEGDLWKKDLKHKISIINFIQDLDLSSLRAEHLISNVTEMFAGQFLLLCKACFNSDGTGKRCSKRLHLPQCTEGHNWNDNKMLVFQRVTGNLIVVRNAAKTDGEIEERDEDDRNIWKSVSTILRCGLTFEDILDAGRRIKQRTLATMKRKERTKKLPESFLEDLEMPIRRCCGLNSSEAFDSYFRDALDFDVFDEDTGDQSEDDESDLESRRRPSWRPYYTLSTIDQLEKSFEDCREGTLHLRGRFNAVCEVDTERNESVSIKISGRANCGPAFDGDKVCVKLVPTRDREDVRETTKGTVLSIKKRVINRRARVFVCAVENNQGNLMTPLCGSVPKIHTSLEKKCSRENKRFVDVYRMTDDGLVKLRRVDLKQTGQERALFAVKYLRWDYWCPYPLGYVCKVIPIKKDIDTNQNVINLLHQIDMSDNSDSVPFVSEYEDVIDNIYASELLGNAREHLGHLFTFSIDPDRCECVDDAFSIEKVNKDLFRVWIHISDVSQFVAKDGEVDMRAQAKGRTVYSADRSNTCFMLPDELASKFLSLKESEPRLAISVYFEMDSTGELRGESRIRKSVVVNNRQLTYRNAQVTIARYRGANDFGIMNDIDRRIIQLHKLAKHLRATRLMKAQHYFSHKRMDDSQEALFAYGGCHDAHRLVEEFMILTNKTIADYLLNNSSSDLIPLRRQKKPPSTKLNAWVQRHETIRRLSHYFDQFRNHDVFQGNSTQSLKSIALLQSSWTALKDAVEAANAEKIRIIVGSEQRHPNHCLAINDWWEIQEPAIFSTSTDDQQHFGLRVPHYVQFTSPIRRYMDIVIHRLVTDIITDGYIITYTADEIQAMCEKSNQQKKMHKSYKQSCELLLIADRLKVPHFLPCFVKTLTPFSITFEVPYLIKTKMKELTLSYSALGVNGLKDEKPQDAESTDYYSEVTLVWRKRFFDTSGHRSNHAREAAQNEHPFRLNLEVHGKRILARDWLSIHRAIARDSLDGDLVREIRQLINTIVVNEILPTDDASDDSVTTVTDDAPDIPVSDSSNESVSEDAKDDFVSDVTSEMKGGKMIVNHYVSFSLTLKPGSILFVQFVGELGKALLEPEIKMVNITSTKDACVEHRTKPFKCFPNSSVAKPTPLQYEDHLDYIETWNPILDLEAVTSAVSDGDSILCENVPITFRGDPSRSRQLSGSLRLSLSFCATREIKVSRDCREADFMHDFLCIRSEEADDRFGEFKRNVWTCHAVTVKAVAKDDEDVIDVFFKVTSYSVPPPVKLLDVRKHFCSVELLYRTLPNK